METGYHYLVTMKENDQSRHVADYARYVHEGEHHLRGESHVPLERV